MAAGNICVLCSIVLLIVAQSGAQRATTTTPRPVRGPAKRGLVLTVKKSYYSTRDGAQIRSIPAIPYYDQWDNKVPGIRFNNSDIHFLSIDADYSSKLLYLYDFHLKSIAIGEDYNPDLVLGNMSFDFMYAGASKATIQVAFDWLSRTLYFGDPGFGWIVAVPGDPARIADDLRRIVVKDLDKPNGIAVDPHSQLLFWSDTGVTKKIERSTLTGDSKRTLVTSGLHMPLALEADHSSQRLYWLDSYREEIKSCLYDGRDIMVIRRIAGASLFDIAIYQEMAIISDISDGRIYFINKTDGERMYSTIRIGSETTYGIAVYTEDNQPKKNQDYCLAKQCPHLCMTTAPPENARCVCSEGYEYLAANNTCIEQAGAYHRIIILLTPTDICYGDIRSLASYDYPNAKCVFTTRATTTPYPTTTTSPRQRFTDIFTTSYPSTAGPPRSSSTTTQTPQEPVEDILFMDVDMKERILYFASEKNIYSRSIDQMEYGNIKTGVTATNLKISGLVYDWVDRYNLYYSTTSGYIYVKNVKTVMVRAVIKSLTTLMKDLVLMPHDRALAWTITDNGGSKIQTSLVYGPGDVQTIVDNRAPIRALTYDQHTKTFYWVESVYVYQYKPNSTFTSPRIIRYSSNFEETTYLLQVYKNSLIIGEKEGNTTYFATVDLTSTQSEKPVRASGYFSNVLNVNSFKIVDTALQPDEPSFCKHDNGNCEQLCLTTHDGNGLMQKRCDCSYGFKLQDDGVSCKSDVQTDVDYLLVDDWTHDQIYQVDLTTEKFHAIRLDPAGTPKALLYNPLTELVMYSLENSNAVYATKIDGTSPDIYALLDPYSTANRFALDYTTGNIYYVSTTYNNQIGVITPHNTYIDLRVVGLPFYADLKAIAVHPGKGFMYYAVQDYRQTYIGRAYMDGKNDGVLINGTDMVWPEGLTIDYTKGYLYWSDRYYDTIKRCDLDGQNCELFIEDSGADISDILTDGDYLYYTSYRNGIMKVSLNDVSRAKVPVGAHVDSGRLQTLSIFRKDMPNTQPVSEGCKDNNGRGPCSTICLPQPFGRFVCACERGAVFIDDQMRTCSGGYQTRPQTCSPPECLSKAHPSYPFMVSSEELDTKRQYDAFLCDSFVGNAQAPSTCSRHADTWCELECQQGYMLADPSTNMTKYCSRLGWDTDITPQLCIETKCPSVPNVRFATSCTMKENAVCRYECQPGFSATQDPASATCLPEGKWDITDFCKETTCPVLDAIPNGEFISCQGKINMTCNFKCNTYFSPSFTPALMICQSSGVWNKDLNTACAAVSCPTTIPNGIIDACTKAVGANCQYKCSSPNFVATASEIVCTAQGAWSPDPACKRKPCTTTIANGAFPDCSGEYNKDCNFTCNTKYKPSISTSKLSCGAGGQWKNGQTNINTTTLCTEVLCTAGIPNAILENSCNKKVLSYCDFTCKTGYQKNNGVTTAMCMDTGVWNTNNIQESCVPSCGDGQFRCNSGQCIPMAKECDKTPDCDDQSDEGDRCVACQGTIPNGALFTCTDYSVGRSCNYTCNKGYRKTDASVVCVIGGEWSNKNPCEEISCKDGIPNADLQTGCNKTMSAVCDFTCKTGYVKNKGVSKATCTNKGVWSTNGVTACVMFCPANISNGALVDCDRLPGKRCNFTCNAGYSKPGGVDQLICMTGGVWHNTNPCQVTQCPRNVQNGKISNDCQVLTVGTSCKVVCNTHYELVQNKMVTCQQSGKWSVSENICQAIIIKPQKQTQQQGLESGAVAGIVVGVIILLIIVAAVVAFVILYKRRLLPGRFGSSPSAKYSTSDIAIENPGYMTANISVTDDSRDDPYSNANDYQPSGYSNGPEPHDTGYVNPMYKTKIQVGSQEPLPEQSDIAINQDDVVLTTDSWRHEQLKGPEV